MKNVYLVGYMGSGKSFLGRKMAKKYQLAFVDMDSEIERRQNKSIVTIFKESGENEFRKIEQQVLKDTFKLKNVLVATGGGTACYKKNMNLMNKGGITIYLKVPFLALLKNINTGKNSRPLASKKHAGTEEQYHKLLFKERQSFYEQAMHVVKQNNIEKLDKLVIQHLTKY
ncbi:MAG: shikimate kinase [Bacteroidetes bacterium]|nr:shikimate kinase [Bacteroidota bacterium]